MAAPRQANIDTEYLAKGRKRASERHGFSEAAHPVEPKDIVALVEKNYEVNGSRMFTYYGELMTSFLWRFGVHHYRLDNQSGMLVPTQKRRDIERPYLNLVGPEVETIVGMLLRATPEGKVLPGSEDPMDRYGARKADNFLKFKNEKDGTQRKHWTLAEVGAICGNAYGAVDIDTTDAETFEMPVLTQAMGPDGIMQTIPVLDANGQPATETIRLADETFTVLLPLQVLLSRGATSFDKSRVVHTHTFCDYEWARAEFPDVAEDLEDIKTPQGAGMFQWRLMDLMRELSFTGYSIFFGGSGDAQGGSDSDRSVICHVVRIRPDADYPLGRRFTVVGKACVGAGPLTFGQNDKQATMDVVQYAFAPIAGSAYAAGMVKDLIHPNKWIEGIHYQVALSRRRMMPRWIYPTDTGGTFEAWAQGQIADEPGKSLSYVQSQVRNKPELVTYQGGIDAAIKEEIRMFSEDYFGRISGTQQILRGENPSPYAPHSSVRMLADKAAERHSPKIGDFHSTIEKSTTIRLKAIAHAPAWQFPQRIAYPGRVGRQGFMIFSAGDMRDNFRYAIMAEAKNAPDPVTKMQLAFDMWDRAILNQIDPKVRLAIIRLAGTPELLDEGGVDVQKAERECAFIEAGLPVEVWPLDNHMVEISVHLAVAKSDEFTTWPQETQQALMDHVMQHIEMMEVQQMSQQRAALETGQEIPGAPNPATFGHQPPSPLMLPSGAGPPGMVGQPGAAVQLPAGGRGRGGGSPNPRA